MKLKTILYKDIMTLQLCLLHALRRNYFFVDYNINDRSSYNIYTVYQC